MRSCSRCLIAVPRYLNVCLDIRPSCRRNVFYAGFLPRWGSCKSAHFYLFERQACILRPLDDSSLDVAKGKKGAPRSHSTQRYGNSAFNPLNARAGLGTPGPCLSDGAPVIFRHLTRLALCLARCLARIVALWIIVLHFSSPAACRQDRRPSDQKSARWLDLGDLASPAGTWRCRLKSCQSPVPSPPQGRSAAQKSQSVPVTKLPPQLLPSRRLVSLFIALSLAPRLTTDDLKIPGADDDGKRTYPYHNFIFFSRIICCTITIHQHQARVHHPSAARFVPDCILT